MENFLFCEFYGAIVVAVAGWCLINLFGFLCAIASKPKDAAVSHRIGTVIMVDCESLTSIAALQRRKVLESLIEWIYEICCVNLFSVGVMQGYDIDRCSFAKVLSFPHYDILTRLLDQ